MPTTASEWLAEHPEDVGALTEMLAGLDGFPIQVWTEMPEDMKRIIAEQLVESFAQPYWDDISAVTAGHAEEYLVKGLQEGWSIRRIASTMAESFQGGTSKYAMMRATRIARTESGHALNAARKAPIDQLMAELGPQVPMQPVWLSVLGNTTRDSHANLDGVPADENGEWELGGVKIPWPGHISLPASERCNCFPAGTLVEGDFVGSQRAWYEGEFAKIVTASGRRLTVTKNHPIVTSKGLVAASMLQPGDKVLAYNSKINSRHCSPVGVDKFAIDTFASHLLSSGNQKQDKPAPIEQVCQAFFSGFISSLGTGLVEIRDTQMDDFYGDGKFIKGKIEIVRANWKLLQDGKFGQFEKCGDSIFVLEPAELSVKFGDGSSRFCGVGVSGAATCFPCCTESLLDVRGRFEITPSGSLAVGVAADFNTSLKESAAKEGAGVSSFLRDSLQRYPGVVLFDEITEVQNFYASHYVYDLQSSYGLIVAFDPDSTGLGGIVNSNCQCTIVTQFGMQEGDAQQLIQQYFDRKLDYEGGKSVSEKFNPYHGPDGRFSSGSGGGAHMAPDTGGGAGGGGGAGIGSFKVGTKNSKSERRLHKTCAKFSRDDQMLDEDFNTPARRINEQAAQANGVRERFKKPKADFEIRVVRTKDVTPSQDYDDWMDDHAKNMAGLLRKFNGPQATDMMEGEVINVVTPIAIEKGGKLIDGNHRHAAHVINGEDHIVAIVALERPQATGKVVNMTEALQALRHMKSAELLEKFNPHHGSDGRFSSGSGGGAHMAPDTGGGAGGSAAGGGSTRSSRAKRTHKPSTKEKQQRAESEQARLAKLIRGTNTDDNDAFDVLGSGWAVEVKTIMDNNNNKITMHPKSRRRKESYAEEHGVTKHTVVIDVRGSKRSYYHKAGVGAYRLSSMSRISVSEIRERLGA